MCIRNEYRKARAPAIVYHHGRALSVKDEGEACAERMRDAGVTVKTKCYTSMAHVFFAFPLPAAAGLMKKIGRIIWREIVKAKGEENWN